MPACLPPAPLLPHLASQLYFDSPPSLICLVEITSQMSKSQRYEINVSLESDQIIDETFDDYNAARYAMQGCATTEYLQSDVIESSNELYEVPSLALNLIALLVNYFQLHSLEIMNVEFSSSRNYIGLSALSALILNNNQESDTQFGYRWRAEIPNIPKSLSIGTLSSIKNELFVILFCSTYLSCIIIRDYANSCVKSIRMKGDGNNPVFKRLKKWTICFLFMFFTTFFNSTIFFLSGVALLFVLHGLNIATHRAAIVYQYVQCWIYIRAATSSVALMKSHNAPSQKMMNFLSSFFVMEVDNLITVIMQFKIKRRFVKYRSANNDSFYADYVRSKVQYTNTIAFIIIIIVIVFFTLSGVDFDTQF
jgi:hypothetical protein